MMPKINSIQAKRFQYCRANGLNESTTQDGGDPVSQYNRPKEL